MYSRLEARARARPRTRRARRDGSPAQCSPVSRSITRPRPGTASSGSSSSERLEREAALVQTRVRDGQARLVDRLVAVEQQVEVDRARAPALARARGRARARPRAARRAGRAAESSVSSATAPFRNGGWSTTPTGSVSRSSETPTTARAARRPRPDRRLAVAEVRAERRRRRASSLGGDRRAADPSSSSSGLRRARSRARPGTAASARPRRRPRAPRAAGTPDRPRPRARRRRRRGSRRVASMSSSRRLVQLEHDVEDEQLPVAALVLEHAVVGHAA